jgi:tetratricopeptide (TPR) repeat protein
MSEREHKTDGRALPRGASPTEIDRIRASVRVAQRNGPMPLRSPETTPRPVIAAGDPPTPDAEVKALIEAGRAALDTNPQEAHAAFEKAYRRKVNDVRILSNYGLTLVLVEGDRQRGIRFCEEAVRRGPLTSEMLVNLARALVVTRNKEQAVRALRRAQELSPADPRVGREFLALGLRRPAPIPWLPRTFFLNKWIGKLTWRLSKKRFDPTQSALDLQDDPAKIG